MMCTPQMLGWHLDLPYPEDAVRWCICGTEVRAFVKSVLVVLIIGFGGLVVDL